MAGVLPIGKLNGEAKAAFFWSLQGTGYAAWRDGGLDMWRAEVTSLWPEAAPIVNAINDDEIVFARYAHHMSPCPIEGRVTRIGDAWHAASPQLGQGANMAMLDALAFAQALEMAPDLESAQEIFMKARYRHVNIYQAISWAFTPFYQSTSRMLPMIRDAIGPISGLPLVRTILAKMVAGGVGAGAGL